MSVTTFRDTIRRISPPWLQRFWGQRFLYTFGVHLDALGDALSAAIKMRFPNVYSNESLSILGRDRGIRRGPEESDASYAARLDQWLETHRRTGNPYTLLRQIQGNLTPHLVKLRIVNNAGAWYTLNADGSVAYNAPSGNWNWDGSSADFSRFWVIIYPPADLWVRDANWGASQIWGAEPGTWGSTATADEVATVRGIIAQWMAPHALCLAVIISFDSSAFAPTDTAPPLPDGTWKNFSKNVGGVQVPARDARGIYWQGVP